MSILRTLLDEIVDYAGLFPPAALDFPIVIDNYAKYFDGPSQWMLSKLIVPASRLNEFEDLAGSVANSSQWRISALVPSADAPEDAFAKSMNSISEFNARGNAQVDAIEIKAPQVEQINIIGDVVPDNINAFLEVPHAHDPSGHIVAIQETGKLFAKIRTGGVTPELIPPTAQVARFIACCAKHQVGFKATAGLHHPIRNEFNLTYADDSQRSTMHGFLNVFCAAAFAFAGAELQVIQDVLDTHDFNAFDFAEDGIGFGGMRVDKHQIETLRNKYAISFGSCSFEEPVDDLRPFGFEAE